MDKVQGGSAEQTEPYFNTVKEYHSFQRSNLSISNGKGQALPGRAGAVQKREVRLF